jgi:aconitase B
MNSSKRKILVVANRTADSPELIAALRERAESEAASLTLLVPAVPRGLAWAADMKAGWADAVLRAELAVERMRQSGLELEEAIVGDPDPYAAVGDVLHAREFDEVVVSVLPRTISSWLALGLPARLRRTVDLPVTQVDASAQPLGQPVPARVETPVAA